MIENEKDSIIKLKTRLFNLIRTQIQFPGVTIILQPTKSTLYGLTPLIGTFGFVLIFDVIVKMLNTRMLSINTFTTLGFGEIPIKGLPRYLAIIQGFIGWFMLTIFSVSLITLLLKW